MLTLTDPAATTAITDDELRHLVDRRFDEIADGEPFDPEIHGVFIVVEESDCTANLENVSGCPILTNPISHCSFGDPEFRPLVEYLGEHSRCFEMVFVSGDGDFGIVIFIPKKDGIDPELLSFCRHYADPAEEVS